VAGAALVESCDGPAAPRGSACRQRRPNAASPHPGLSRTCPPPAPPLSETSPAISVAITVLVALLALTGFGVYTAFGPPSKQLTDPFDDHDD
jgi:PsbN protein